MPINPISNSTNGVRAIMNVGDGIPPRRGASQAQDNRKRNLSPINRVRNAEAEQIVWNTLGAVYPEGWGPSTQQGYTDLSPDLDTLSKSMINEQWPSHGSYTWTSGQPLNRTGTGSQSWGLAVERVFTAPSVITSASIVTGSINSGLRHVTSLVAVTHPDNALVWLANNYQNTDGAHTVTLNWTGEITATKMLFIYIGRIMQTVGVSRNRYIYESKINYL